MILIWRHIPFRRVTIIFAGNENFLEYFQSIE
jgi:hypothetical protein